MKLKISLSLFFLFLPILGDAKDKKHEPVPKDFSTFYPNLVQGSTNELKTSEKANKFQHSPKDPSLQPIHEERDVSFQFKTGSFYPPGEDLYFSGTPPYSFSDQEIPIENELNLTEEGGGSHE